jgi:hypothetical protein
MTEICLLSFLLSIARTLRFFNLSTHVPFLLTVVIFFGNLGFKVFNSRPSLSPGILSSVTHDLSICVSHRSMTMIHFGSLHGVHGFLPCPSELDNYDLLQVFTLCFPLEYSVPEVLDLASCIHFKSMALVHFETSAFGSLNSSMLSFV